MLTIESDTTVDINGAVVLNGAITGATNITLSGELDADTLDIEGNADINGTLETDNLTINGSQGSDGQVLTSTGTGVAWEAAASGGLTMATTYQCDSDVSNPGNGSNLDIWAIRDASDGYGTLGTAVGYTSGVFDFKDEGYWLIQYQCNIYGASTNVCVAQLVTTTNNSTYASATKSVAHLGSSQEGQMTGSFLFNVTDKDNYKCAFQVDAFGGNVDIAGDTSVNSTHITFTRLASTS